MYAIHLELSWCEQFGDGKRKSEQCRWSSTSSYVVHATPKCMSFHVVDRKRTVVKWAMFPFETLSSPRHTWGRAKQNASRGNLLRRFLRVRRSFGEKSTSRRYQTCLNFFAPRGKFLVVSVGSPFIVLIIIQYFTTGPWTAVVVRLMVLYNTVFHYGTAVSVFIILFAISLRYRGLLSTSNGSLWTGIL